MNGAIQPIFAILLLDIIVGLVDPFQAEQTRDESLLYSLVFVVVGVIVLIGSIIQVSAREEQSL